MRKTPSSLFIEMKLRRIAKAAHDYPKSSFTTLAHHVDIDWLREAYFRTRKSGAPDIDGLTAQEYEANLESNLQSLLDRFKSGTYWAPAVRRVHIPKGPDGKQTRPIGIPTFEDKVLQRAVTMLLEGIYEEDFKDCSYGFRPGRSAHDALQAVWRATMGMNGGWVLEVDIRKFFDSLSKDKLMEMLRKRVCDGVLLKIIGKRLNAGVLEDGELEHPSTGTPQGGVISPLLANIYLHEVIDVWFHTAVLSYLQGRARLIRYADDMVMVFEREDDARLVFRVLPKRFGKYGLALHPDKTRLVKFHSAGEDGCRSRSRRSNAKKQQAKAKKLQVCGRAVKEHFQRAVANWFATVAQAHHRAYSWLIQYANEVVMFFGDETDAHCTHAALTERIGMDGVTLHAAEVWKLKVSSVHENGRWGRSSETVKNSRPSAHENGPGGRSSEADLSSRTLDFLGFTHSWGHCRRGTWVVQQRTSRSRLSRTLHKIRQWCRIHRHEPVRDQQQALVQKLRGHYGYFGITSNIEALQVVYRETRAAWRKWLSRRSRKGQVVWEKMVRLLERFPLPEPRIVHRYGASCSKPMF